MSHALRAAVVAGLACCAHLPALAAAPGGDPEPRAAPRRGTRSPTATTVPSSTWTPPAEAVVVEIPWRRPDAKPEAKDVIVIDAATGLRVSDVARIAVDRERGHARVPAGDGARRLLRLLPAVPADGPLNYPTVVYPKPADFADSLWLARTG